MEEGPWKAKKRWLDNVENYLKKTGVRGLDLKKKS
jgi:hypothetical protein